MLSLRHGDGQEQAPCEGGLLSDPLPHLPPAKSGLPGAKKCWATRVAKKAEKQLADGAARQE